MIARSRKAKGMALAMAALIHGAAVTAWTGSTPVLVAGAAGVAEVQIGSSFADMAAGTLSAQPAPAPAPSPAAAVVASAVTAEVAPVAALEALYTEPALPGGMLRPVPPMPTMRAGAPQVLHAVQAAEQAMQRSVDAAPRAQPDTALVLPESAAPQISKRPMRRDPSVERSVQPAKATEVSRAAPPGNGD